MAFGVVVGFGNDWPLRQARGNVGLSRGCGTRPLTEIGQDDVQKFQNFQATHYICIPVTCLYTSLYVDHGGAFRVCCQVCSDMGQVKWREMAKRIWGQALVTQRVLDVGKPR